MTFKPGQSGNPKGRNPKKRAWAELIGKYGRQDVTLYDGTKIQAQELIAKLTIEGLLTGYVNFPRLQGDSRKLRALKMRTQDWIRFLGKTREHLEGSVVQADLTSGDEPIATTHFYLPKNGRETEDDENDD